MTFVEIRKSSPLSSVFVTIKLIRRSCAPSTVRRMQRAIIFALPLFFPTVLHARVIKWEGKPISVSVSTERLTRIEFSENLRSVFLSRSDIGVEREERSLGARRLSDRSLSAIDRTVPDLRADTPTMNWAVLALRREGRSTCRSRATSLTAGARSKCILIHTNGRVPCGTISVRHYVFA